MNDDGGGKEMRNYSCSPWEMFNNDVVLILFLYSSIIFVSLVDGGRKEETIFNSFLTIIAVSTEQYVSQLQKEEKKEELKNLYILFIYYSIL